MQLLKQQNMSNSPKLLPSTTTFSFQIIQSCSGILHLGGAYPSQTAIVSSRPSRKIATYLDIHSEAYNPNILRPNIYFWVNIRTTIAHKERPISIILIITNPKINSKNKKTSANITFCDGLDHRKHELHLSRSYTGIEEVNFHDSHLRSPLFCLLSRLADISGIYAPHSKGRMCWRLKKLKLRT